MGRFRAVIVWLVMLLLLGPGAVPVWAQFNAAYSDGYKAMTGYASILENLTKSDNDFDKAKDLGTSYVARLEIVIAALDRVGKDFKHDESQTWAATVRVAPRAAARLALSRAEKLRDAGNMKAVYRGIAIDLEKALKEFVTEFKKCHEEHEKRLRETYDRYVSARELFQKETKDDRRPLEELARKVADLRKALDAARTANDSAERIYLELHMYSEKLRDELAKLDKDKTPNEHERKWIDWKTALELVRRGGIAAVDTSDKFDSASKAYRDALNEYKSKSEAYNKEMAEGNVLYERTIQRHRAAFEMGQEYKPFSW